MPQQVYQLFRHFEANRWDGLQVASHPGPLYEAARIAGPGRYVIVKVLDTIDIAAGGTILDAQEGART